MFVPKIKNYALSLSSIKTLFTKALDAAKILESQMDQDISAKTEEVMQLNETVIKIEAVKAQNQKFMENITKIIE